jgi:hypothetical protein
MHPPEAKYGSQSAINASSQLGWDEEGEVDSQRGSDARLAATPADEAP